MNKKQCKDALEIYKRFLVRMDKVSEFLKTAEVRTVSGLGSVWCCFTVDVTVFGNGARRRGGLKGGTNAFRM